MRMWPAEAAFSKKGYRSICGVAVVEGPSSERKVCAATVILPTDLPERVDIPGLDSSSSLSLKERKNLASIIKAIAVAWTVETLSYNECKEVGESSARIWAMQKAIEKLDPAPDFALISGKKDRANGALILIPHQRIINGGELSSSIAAAWVLAKVALDNTKTEPHGAQHPPKIKHKI